MNERKLISNLMLVLTAMIWGGAFVAQSVGMDHLGPYTFNAVRFTLGGIVLIPVVFLLRKKGIAENVKKDRKQQKAAVVGGICCGVCLGVASSLQQLGILYSEAVGKVGFITSLYIIMVPILGIFVGKKTGINIWLSVLIATAGMYLLCITEGFSVQRGDYLVFLCALAFSVHIMVIDYFSARADGVVISCIQLFIAGGFTAVFMAILETPTLAGIVAAGIPILYAGVCSCGIAYTFQIVAQKHVEPTIASLIMSLESVFSLLAGWLILHERLSVKELFGCMMVFAAIVLAQVPTKKESAESASQTLAPERGCDSSHTP